jgi:hypothetical protein
MKNKEHHISQDWQQLDFQCSGKILLAACGMLEIQLTVDFTDLCSPGGLESVNAVLFCSPQDANLNSTLMCNYFHDLAQLGTLYLLKLKV